MERLATFISVLLFSFLVYSSPAHFSFQGRALDSQGEIVDEGTLTIVTQVRNPSNDCLLYEETRDVTMDNSGGYFSVLLGLGTRTADSPNFVFSSVFSNDSTLTDPKMGCASYTPGTSDGRLLRVFIDGERLDPDMVLSSVPFSLHAGQSANSVLFSGKPAADFLQKNGTNVTQTALDGFFNAAAGLGNSQSLRWNSVSGWEVFTPGAAGSGVNSLTINSPISNTGTASDPVLGVSEATTSASGLMSSSDKTKLDGIASGAEANVASDWNASSGDAQILNKPDLSNLNASVLTSGTVNNARLDSDLQDLADGSLSASLIENGGFMIGSAGTSGQLWRSDGSGQGVWWTPNYLSAESDPTVPASIKDGISWAEVSGKPSLADGHSLDASDGTPADAVFVDAAGNVGVGTTSPADKLQVDGNVRASVGAQYQGFNLLRTDNNDSYSISADGTGANSRLGIWTYGATPFSGGTNRLTIMKSSGNVGIGTASPSEKLDVSGTVKATAFEGDGSNLTNISAAAIADNSITVGDLDFASSNGINIPQLTSDPGSPTAGQIYYNTTNNKMMVYNGSTWIESGSGSGTSSSMIEGWPDAIQCDNVILYRGYENNYARAWVDSTNNSKNDQIDFNSDGTWLGYRSTHGTDWSAKDCGGKSISTLLSEGKAFKFIGGSSLANDADNDTKIHTEESSDEDKIRFDTAGSERMIIDNSGNVGIGTTSPDAKLDIDGDVKIGNSSATCSSTTEGSQRYNSSSKKMEFCNGTAWSEFGSGSPPSGTICGMRSIRCGGSFYDEIGPNSNCLGNTLAATCSGNSVGSVSNCPSGYTGRNMSVRVNSPYIYSLIYCVKD